MFKHILVPLDGSKMAEAALTAAAFFSGEFKGIVTLFHVIERNAPREIHGQPHLKNAAEAATYLEEISVRAFPKGCGVDFHVHTTSVDNVAESIVEHANELNCDVIIMCSHGRGKALHLFLGSIAELVISGGSLPVVVTPAAKEGEGMPEFSCKSVLLPLDGVEEHEQALPVSKELAGTCGSVLHLAMVIPGFENLSGQRAVASRFLPGTTSKILEISVQNAIGYLLRHQDKLRSEGFDAGAYVLRGDPAAVIDDAARRFQVDLIVMATHGKSGLNAFWAGSVTHKVSGRIRIPLLLVPVKRK